MIARFVRVSSLIWCPSPSIIISFGQKVTNKTLADKNLRKKTSRSDIFASFVGSPLDLINADVIYIVPYLLKRFALVAWLFRVGRIVYTHACKLAFGSLKLNHPQIICDPKHENHAYGKGGQKWNFRSFLYRIGCRIRR